ncbi:MAG: FMN-binding protein [Nitrospirae bacterium]|nr:FMN-binding protein [Nitrospirota bacterium]MBF0533900.1 FMN-binding protein [Nitrospirota bacterium]MBF0615391.1 FMN-binding protein [Nitrospirota bacterium]
MNTKEIIKITINLLIIYIVGGVLLAGVYAKTSPLIFQANEKEKKEALQRMMPEADKIEKLGDWHPHEKHAEYFVAKKDGKVLGYVVQAFGKGYSSYINILFSVGEDFVIKNMDILKQAETPGLGDEVSTESFKKQFPGKKLDTLKVVKEETKEYVQAITGATISSRAVTEDGVKKGLEFLQGALKGDGGHGDAKPTEEH